MPNGFIDNENKLVSQSMKEHNKQSKNSKTGYMDRGNSSKIAAKQGTRNK